MRPSLVTLAIPVLALACSQRLEIGRIDEAVGEGGSGPLVLEPTNPPIAASALSTCAVTSVGGVACWGRNQDAELGIGDTTPDFSATPVTPVGLDAGVLGQFGGGTSQCARLVDGRLSCWGGSLYFFVNGFFVQAFSLEPYDLKGAGGTVVQLVAGVGHLCVLTDNGTAQCVGYGSGGVLGNGDTVNTYPFANVASDVPFRHLSASSAGYHMCGVTAEGGVSCWGENTSEQLGQPGSDASSPVEVSAIEQTMVAVAAGLVHSCALGAAGEVVCWGNNSRGQLGRPIEGLSGAPEVVAGVPAMTAIAAGGYMTCGLSEAGAVVCWGDIDDTDTASPATEVVEPGFGTTHLVCGAGHGCAINAQHQVRCWGRDDFGQTGGGALSL